MSRKTYRVRLNNTVSAYNKEYALQNLSLRFSGYNPQFTETSNGILSFSVDSDEHLTNDIVRDKLLHSSFVLSVSTGDPKKRVIKVPKVGIAMKFNELKDTQRHAGLMVKAKDTGRVLFIQKGPEDKHGENKGLWELPGGHVEEGEDVLETALREWEEEVGAKLPKGKIKDSWVQVTEKGKEYHTFVYVIKKEKLIKLNPTKKDEAFENPDNKSRRPMDIAAWFMPENLQVKRYVRQTLEETDWKRVKEATGGNSFEWQNGQGTIDSASLNPQTTEEGSSGVTQKLFTPGEDQMSYTIGDHTGKKLDDPRLKALDGIEDDEQELSSRPSTALLFSDGAMPTSKENSGKTGALVTSWVLHAEVENMNSEGIGSMFVPGGTPEDSVSNITDVQAPPPGPQSKPAGQGITNTNNIPMSNQGQQGPLNNRSWYTSSLNFGLSETYDEDYGTDYPEF